MGLGKQFKTHRLGETGLLQKEKIFSAAPQPWGHLSCTTSIAGDSGEKFRDVGTAVAAAGGNGESLGSTGVSTSETEPVSHCSHKLTINRHVITTVAIRHS